MLSFKNLKALSILFMINLLFIPSLSHAGTIRDRIMERRLAQQAEEDEGNEPSGSVPLPAGVTVLRDLTYGKDNKQSMDVYLPSQATSPAVATGAPVIFMVHGGAWRLGDKGAKTVVENKVSRWVPKGFVFISINYRLLPKTAPAEQAKDVATALALAQSKAASWGGDPAKFIVMGHSAGAHLVALLAVAPAEALKLGARPWLGSILLDSGALNLMEIMEAKHFRFYDRAFGKDPAYWKAMSPFHGLSETATPMLAVCSTHRSDSVSQANRFVAKAVSLHLRASVLEQDLSHKEINQRLGVAGRYTDAVEAFMGTLDESVMRMLTQAKV